MQQVGQGAYGDVWLAVDARSGECAALKRVKAQTQNAPPAELCLDAGTHGSALQQQLLVWIQQQSQGEKDGFPRTVLREISILNELKGEGADAEEGAETTSGCAAKSRSLRRLFGVPQGVLTSSSCWEFSTQNVSLAFDDVSGASLTQRGGCLERPSGVDWGSLVKVRERKCVLLQRRLQWSAVPLP